MEILIHCEYSIQKFESNRKYAIISIQDPNYDFVPLKKSTNLLGVLQLKCYDFDRETGQKNYDKHLFSVEQAKEILDFVDNLKNKIDVLCVNCVAGVSRSAGVGAILNKIYNGNDMYYFNNYCPNMLIYRTIYNLYYNI